MKLLSPEKLTLVSEMVNVITKGLGIASVPGHQKFENLLSVARSYERVITEENNVTDREVMGLVSAYEQQLASAPKSVDTQIAREMTARLRSAMLKGIDREIDFDAERKNLEEAYDALATGKLPVREPAVLTERVNLSSPPPEEQAVYIRRAFDWCYKLMSLNERDFKDDALEVSHNEFLSIVAGHSKPSCEKLLRILNAFEKKFEDENHSKSAEMTMRSLFVCIESALSSMNIDNMEGRLEEILARAHNPTKETAPPPKKDDVKPVAAPEKRRPLAQGKKLPPADNALLRRSLSHFGQLVTLDERDFLDHALVISYDRFTNFVSGEGWLPSGLALAMADALEKKLGDTRYNGERRLIGMDIVGCMRDVLVKKEESDVSVRLQDIAVELRNLPDEAGMSREHHRLTDRVGKPPIR